MTTRKPEAKGSAATARGRGASCVLVTGDQCRSLIEDVAHLRAARHRPVAPGQCRDEDRRAAESEIGAVLKRKTRRK